MKIEGNVKPGFRITIEPGGYEVPIVNGAYQIELAPLQSLWAHGPEGSKSLTYVKADSMTDYAVEGVERTWDEDRAELERLRAENERLKYALTDRLLPLPEGVTP